MAQQKTILAFPLVSYSQRIAKLASNYSPNNVALIRAINKASEAMTNILSENKKMMCENNDLILRKYPIQLDFLETMSANDIEYWKDYIIIVNDDSIVPRIKIADVDIPYILIHEHTPEKRKRPNQLSLSDTINYISLFKKHIENTNKGYELIETSIGHDVTNDIIDEFSIVVNPKLVSERFTDVMYETLWTNSVANRDRISSQKEILKKDIKESFERICSFCVFKICKNKHVDNTDIHRVCYLDGTCLLSSNPLMIIFFLFAFGIRSFITRNEHNKLWVFNSLQKCIEKMKEEELEFPVTNYFSIIRSPPIAEIPAKFVIEGWKQPFNPTYITLNRCNEVILYNAFKKTATSEEIAAKRNEIYGKWNGIVFYRIIDGKTTMSIHRNYNEILDALTDDFTSQCDSKHKSMCVIAFTPKQISNMPMINPIVVNGEISPMPIKQEPKKKTTLIDDEPEEDIKPQPAIPVSSSSDRILDNNNSNNYTFSARPTQQFTLTKTMMDDFMSRIEKMITTVVQKEVEKLRQEIVSSKESIIREFSLMREKDFQDILAEFNDFGVIQEESEEKGLLDDSEEEDDPNEFLQQLITSSSKKMISKRTAREPEESSSEESEEDEPDSEVLLDEEKHKTEINALIENKMCTRMTIEPSKIHSKYPLDITNYPVMVINSYDIFDALLPQKKEDKVNSDDDCEDAEDGESKRDIIKDIVVCRMDKKCATDEVGELTIPHGLIGYNICIDYACKEDKHLFLLPNSLKYDLNKLQLLLSLYNEVVSNSKNRIKLVKIIDTYLTEDKLGEAIDTFPNRCGISICRKCYRRDDKFVTKAEEYKVKAAKSKRNIELINDVMYLDIYHDIKKHIPQPLKEGEFDPTMEYCMNCNMGFHWKQRDGRKPYIQLVEDISKMAKQTRKVHYESINFHDFTILLEIPLVLTPQGSAFCCTDCEDYFKKRITNLKRFITNQTKKQSK